jgi:predicted GNAT family N-acyltransferase
MPLEVLCASDPLLLREAWKVRYTVFVDEQGVPPAEELDQYEKVCRHFIARDTRKVPCGAARWRFTDQGVKLERFAVLKHMRGMGVGSALLQAVLDDIRHHPDYIDQPLYLHAQLGAIPLYSKFGFAITGGIFEECNIKHRKMVKTHP